MLTKKCLFCDKTFTRNYHISLKIWNERTKFCSRICSSNYRKGKLLKHLKEYQFKKGVTTWNKGLTKENNIRARESSIRMKENNPMKRTEIREKSSNSHLGEYPSIEDRRKRSKSMMGKNSKGGITSENERIRGSIEIRLWREAVFARDNWTCQKCKERGGKLHSHHIKNFAQYPELRTSIENGITLCKKCHELFHKIYGRQNNTREQIINFTMNVYEKF